MSSYYYLMSSLPMLKADGEMPFSYRTFLDMCRGNISESLCELLIGLTPESNEGPMIAQWGKFYGILKEELTYQRRVRLGKTCQAPVERDEAVIRTVTAAMNEENPLEAEQVLLALQFEKLDELVNMHYFDNSALVGYALKLKLLERKTVFCHDEGRTEFDRIADGLQKQVMNME